VKTKKSGLLNCGLGVMHCDKQWDDFEKTDNSNIRFCSLCRKKVIFVSSKTDVNRVLKKDDSIAYGSLEE